MNYEDLQFSFAEVYFRIKEMNIKKDLYGENNNQKFYSRKIKQVNKSNPFSNVMLGGMNL